MFEESLRLFDEYYLAQNGKPGFNTRAAVEFRRRITQLEYLLAEIRERVDTVTAWQATMTGRMLAARATLEERSLAWDDEWPDDIKLRFDAPLQTPLNVSEVSFEIET